MRKIILILALSLCLVGCGSDERVEVTEKTETSVETIYGGKSFIMVEKGKVKTTDYDIYQTYYVFVDTSTNVMYLHIDNGYDGGVIVLVNADGTPRLYEGEFEDAE